MLNKNIGFNRNVKLDWLDAAASFVIDTSDPMEVRQRLDVVLLQERIGSEAKRKTIDILINIWIKNGELYPEILDFAKENFKNVTVPGDRLWLHYGLTMLYYDFFRDSVSVIGKMSRHGDVITARSLKKAMISKRGHLGSLERSARRIISSLRDWNVLVDADIQHTYSAKYRELQTNNDDLQVWLLKCALLAKGVDQLPFEDLIRLPELFPFKFTATADQVRKHHWFNVYRQGAGLIMVELANQNKDV